MGGNNKNEFTFVVTGVELSDEQQERIGRAVAQAGALALGDFGPRDAVAVRLNPKVWWHGVPREVLVQDLQRFAEEEAGIQR
ncbi:hypothetical protein [Streptomyces erythrochromogenes]|uniref:hypothetical protein n=1 Tax=Streptomyces erythrochromogenes TaxID=285574 RepID=UPI00382DFA89